MDDVEDGWVGAGAYSIHVYLKAYCGNLGYDM